MEDENDELADSPGAAQSERPLNERITLLKRRRKELQQQEEEQELLQEIREREERLTRANRPTTYERDPSHAPTELSLEAPASTSDESLVEGRAAQRRRLEDGELALPRRGPKMEKIPVYEGKSVREHQDFERRLRMAFRLDPLAFTQEDQKIAFTWQYLYPTMQRLWDQVEREAEGETPGWRYMMDFLLDQLKSPINRELQVATLYQQARQKEGQSVHDFAAYLSTLENQVSPPYEQHHQVLHLYSRLRKEIRLALSNYTEFPKTRRELVERAATLEENLRLGAGSTAFRNKKPLNQPSNQPSRPLTSLTASPSREIPQTTTFRNTRKPGNCNYCHRPGHWERECPRKKAWRPRNAGEATNANALEVAKK